MGHDRSKHVIISQKDVKKSKNHQDTRNDRIWQPKEIDTFLLIFVLDIKLSKPEALVLFWKSDT